MTQDSIRLASVEVEKAKKDIEDISDKMRQFRDQHTFIDPASEASNLLSIISNLENLITQAKAELAQKRAYLREDSVDILHFAVGMCLTTTFCTRMEEIRFFFETSILRILLI